MSTPVVIVEGEKCADALAGLAEWFGVLSWLGGSGAVLRTDWDVLAGREVILWPDADEPGREAMARLAGELDRIGVAEVRMIDPEEDRPDGWDVADAVAKGRVGDGRKPSSYLLKAERVNREGVPPAQTGSRAGPRFGRRDRTRTDRLDLGALPACRGSHPDGRSARLRQELPEHRLWQPELSRGLTPFHRGRDREDPYGNPFP